MATLATVSDYVNAARVLLQDTVVAYRYPDTDILLALNIGLTEARALRPDLFYDANFTPASYSAVDSTAVAFDVQYRSALLYFIVGWTQLRDSEEDSDTRASQFLNKFLAKLTGIA